MTWKSLYFPRGSHFLGSDDIAFIEKRLKMFPLESVTIGDAGEINNCQVGRLVEDHPGKQPQVVNQNLSQPILDLFSTSSARSFYKSFIPGNPDDQIIRRSQFNLLHAGSYVGRHLDIDSNPKYQIASVLQLGSEFEGGEFFVYENKSSDIESAQKIQPEYGSLTISFCSHEHEVRPVLQGVRTSFVCFISSFKGANPRQN